MNEYDLYRENGILDDVIRKVPDFEESDLMQNLYSLSYKTYANWRPIC